LDTTVQCSYHTTRYRNLYTDARSLGIATTTYTATDAVGDDVRHVGR